MPTLSVQTKADLLRHADAAAEELADKYGKARVGAPELVGGVWTVEVRGIAGDDIEMRGFRIWPSGERQEVG